MELGISVQIAKSSYSVMSKHISPHINSVVLKLKTKSSIIPMV